MRICGSPVVRRRPSGQPSRKKVRAVRPLTDDSCSFGGGECFAVVVSSSRWCFVRVSWVPCLSWVPLQFSFGQESGQTDPKSVIRGHKPLDCIDSQNVCPQSVCPQGSRSSWGQDKSCSSATGGGRQGYCATYEALSDVFNFVR